MPKKLLSLFLTVILFISLVPALDEHASAAVSDTSRYYISFYDTILLFDEEPLRTNGTILAQADILCNAMEAELDYDSENGTVTIKKGDITVSLIVDSLTAFVNGAEETLAASPVIVNETLMIPAEFVAVKLGYITYYTTNFQKRLAINPPYSDEVYAILDKIESECYSEKLVDWIINLYDPESGGFYFKKSAKDTLGFLPDRESTSNCIGMLKKLGCINNDPTEFMSDEMIEKMTSFAREYYNPDDGWWYELPWGKYIGEGKRAYQSSGAGQVLRFLGKSVTETSLMSDSDIADEEISLLSSDTYAAESTDETAERYTSLENFREWLDSLTFDNIYSTGSLLLTNLGPIRNAGDEYYDCVMEFIEAHMNPRTGFFSKIDPETGDWVDEVNFDSMSGTLKVSAMYAESYYAGLGGRYLTMPYFDKLIYSTIEVMLSDETGWHACDLINPVSLIRTARYSQKDVIGNPSYKEALDYYYEKLPDILEVSMEKILMLMCEDGSYSYYAYTGSGGNKGVLHGLNLREGEMSGASMIVEFRTKLYSLLMLPEPEMFDGKIGPEQIRKKLAAVEPTKKIEPAKECNLSFDDMETGALPNGNGSLFRYSGNMEIIADPVSGHGNSLRITADGSLRPALYFDVGSSGSRGFTVSYDIRYEPQDGNNLFLTSEIGSWDYAVKTSISKVSGYSRFIRTTDANKWLTNIKGNYFSDYHTVKIVYKPDCSTAITEYYLDGKLLDTSTYYLNEYPEKRPVKDVSYVHFRANHSEPFVAYIDNFKFRENPLQ